MSAKAARRRTRPEAVANRDRHSTQQNREQLQRENERLWRENEELHREVAERDREIAEREKQIADAERLIADLERQLALHKRNSTNSSKPPSSDGLAGEQRPFGRKHKSKRNPGGQPGHHRELVPTARSERHRGGAAATMRSLRQPSAGKTASPAEGSSLRNLATALMLACQICPAATVLMPCFTVLPNGKQWQSALPSVRRQVLSKM